MDLQIYSQIGEDETGMRGIDGTELFGPGDKKGQLVEGHHVQPRPDATLQAGLLYIAYAYSRVKVNERMAT